MAIPPVSAVIVSAKQVVDRNLKKVSKRHERIHVWDALTALISAYRTVVQSTKFTENVTAYPPLFTEPL